MREMIYSWVFIVCLFKFVFAEQEVVCSGYVDVYNWADPSQKIINANNTYTTTYNVVTFNTVPELCLINTQGFSFEYHDYLAFIAS
jgi:hypothetical protein